MRPLVTERTDYRPSLTYWRRANAESESAAVTDRVRQESFLSFDGFRTLTPFASVENLLVNKYLYFYGGRFITLALHKKCTCS